MDVSAGARPQSTGGVWRRLGTGSDLRLETAEVVEVHLPFRRPVATSIGVHRQRPIVLVHLVGRRAGGALLDGWGECAALSDATYDGEDADRAFTTLVEDLLPALLEASRDGTVPSVDSLIEVMEPGDRPLAWSAMEMAVGDAHLRSAGWSFADLLGVAGAEVAPGAVLGLPASTPDLVEDLRRLRDEGYARVKIKVAPGTERLIREALAHPSTGDLPIQVDANGAYGPSTMDGLRSLDALGLVCIEQPLGRHDAAGHRALSRAFATPICLDESLDSPQRVVESVTSGESSMVCVKPSRLGGIGAALDVIDWCRSTDTPWWIGGMFESGYARRVVAALAAVPGPSLPGDLAPPATYLAADMVGPSPTVVDTATGQLLVTLHEGPGMAPVPDATTVDRWAVRRTGVSRRPT